MHLGGWRAVQRKHVRHRGQSIGITCRQFLRMPEFERFQRRSNFCELSDCSEFQEIVGNRRFSSRAEQSIQESF